MFRLISLLFVVVILGLMGAIAVDSLNGKDCTANGGTTTTLPVAVSKGVERMITGCR